MTRALALVSGGLDSILAAKLVKNQGIEVIGICFKSAFFGPQNAIRMCDKIDIPLEVIDFTEEHIRMTKNPKHGYGKNMNPCIDCHTLMLKMAGRLMTDLKADFLITGEVLNQRPMSQTIQSLNIVKKESGFGERILRPLCAKNLPPTEMELKGLVNRESLFDINGRSRKMQMELAKSFGIEDYPSPAGGCRLTEPGFSKRLQDLYKYNSDACLDDIELLKIGRHFRLSPSAKAVSSRDAKEYEVLKTHIKESDYVFNAEHGGSTVIIRGNPSEEEILFSASIAARYSKENGMNEVEISIEKPGHSKPDKIYVRPVSDEVIVKLIL